MFSCPVCGTPAEVVDTFSLPGVGTRGQDIVVWFDQCACVLGHHYQVELYEEDV